MPLIPRSDPSDSSMDALPHGEFEGAGEPGPVSRILKISVPLVVKLAERRMALAEVGRMGLGAIIEFTKSNEDPLELMVNNKTIAIGEAVKVGENFGLRITQIGDVRDVIKSMGGRRRG